MFNVQTLVKTGDRPDGEKFFTPIFGDLNKFIYRVLLYLQLVNVFKVLLTAKEFSETASCAGSNCYD